MYLTFYKQVRQPWRPEKITFYARAQIHRSITCQRRGMAEWGESSSLRFYLTTGLTGIGAVTGNPLRCWIPR